MAASPQRVLAHEVIRDAGGESHDKETVKRIVESGVALTPARSARSSGEGRRARGKRWPLR